MSEDGKVATRSSFCTTSSSKATRIVPSTWKSDMNIVQSKELDRLVGGRNPCSDVRSSCGEYYKKYEHDAIPVKDGLLAGHGDDHHSLTNTELDKLEHKILHNLSQDPLSGVSFVSLESNVKFFKHTVQQIFDNFYTTMSDFEHYKQKFHQILEKNRNDDSVADMEQFIKDMVHNIMSSDSMQNQLRLSVSNNSADITLEDKMVDGYIQTSEIRAADASTGYTDSDFDGFEESLQSFKDENNTSYYNVADEEQSKKSERASKNGEIFNIYLLTASPCLEIKMNKDRNLLSEINIRSSIATSRASASKVASAENLKKLAAKKKEIEVYAKQSDDSYCQDRDIPVRISSAKKNLYLDEDFISDPEKNECNKGFMAKICNYLCRKLRKGI